MIKKFGLETVKPLTTPMSTTEKLIADESRKVLTQRNIKV